MSITVYDTPSGLGGSFTVPSCTPGPARARPLS